MTPARAPAKFILASASPRRLVLLRQIGIEPDAIEPADVDERPIKGEAPATYVRRLAHEKADHITEDAFILGADTIVVLGNKLLGKPDSAEQARAMLAKLSGRRHRVLTGVAVKAPNGRISSRVSSSEVWFKRLNATEIDAYITSGEWRGKAGAYGIQGNAEQFVKKIKGSYSGIVGLPLYETSCLLRGVGFILGEPTT